MARHRQDYTIDGRIFMPAQRLPRNIPPDEWGNGDPEQTCGNPNCHKGADGGPATFRALNSSSWGYSVNKRMCCSYSCMRELERMGPIDRRKRSGPEMAEPLRELWRLGYKATTAAAKVGINPTIVFEWYARFEEEAENMGNAREVRFVTDPPPYIDKRRKPCVCPECGAEFWPVDVDRWVWTLPGKRGKNGYKRAVCCSYSCLTALKKKRQQSKQTGVCSDP